MNGPSARNEGREGEKRSEKRKSRKTTTAQMRRKCWEQMFEGIFRRRHSRFHAAGFVLLSDRRAWLKEQNYVGEVWMRSQVLWVCEALLLKSQGAWQFEIERSLGNIPERLTERGSDRGLKSRFWMEGWEVCLRGIWGRRICGSWFGHESNFSISRSAIMRVA